MSERLPFFSDCVDWPPELLPALDLVDDATEITLETFRRRTGVNPNPKIRVADVGGYRGPGWIRPWGYSYWRLPGLPVAWYVHSAIEYVYATEETIRRVNDRAVAQSALALS